MQLKAFALLGTFAAGVYALPQDAPPTTVVATSSPLTTVISPSSAVLTTVSSSLNAPTCIVVVTASGSAGGSPSSGIATSLPTTVTFTDNFPTSSLDTATITGSVTTFAKRQLTSDASPTSTVDASGASPTTTLDGTTSGVVSASPTSAGSTQTITVTVSTSAGVTSTVFPSGVATSLPLCSAASSPSGNSTRSTAASTSTAGGDGSSGGDASTGAALGLAVQTPLVAAAIAFAGMLLA